MWDPYGEFESTTLPNGLKVYVTHWVERPWEAIGFVMHSGAEQDPIGLEGMTHFVEHLVSKNASMPQRDMEGFFEDHGGEVNFGLTSHKCTKYHFFVPARNEVVLKAFSLFGQMLLQNGLEKFIERERQVIIGEFRRHYPLRFQYDLDTREAKSLYHGYWLERFTTPLGNPDSIIEIDRADLWAYYEAYYIPANISVVCVGGMNLQQIVELLTQSPFAMTRDGKRTPLPTTAKEIKPPLENRHIFEFSKHVSVAEPPTVGHYKSTSAIPGNVNTSIRILKYMLGQILDDEIRQSRAWTYHTGCSWYNFRHFHEFTIGADALAPESLDSIENVVETCVASLTDREDLFELAKRRAIADNLMMDPRGRGIRDGALDDLAESHRIISLRDCPFRNFPLVRRPDRASVRRNLETADTEAAPLQLLGFLV
jgi:predicted Zn-dependent peptidase